MICQHCAMIESRVQYCPNFCEELELYNLSRIFWFNWRCSSSWFINDIAFTSLFPAVEEGRLEIARHPLLSHKVSWMNGWSTWYCYFHEIAQNKIRRCECELLLLFSVLRGHRDLSLFWTVVGPTFSIQWYSNVITCRFVYFRAGKNFKFIPEKRETICLHHIRLCWLQRNATCVSRDLIINTNVETKYFMYRSKTWWVCHSVLSEYFRQLHMNLSMLPNCLKIGRCFSPSTTRDLRIDNVLHILMLSEPEGSIFLFDCGEGAVRQILKTPMKHYDIGHIFLTHMHGDHVSNDFLIFWFDHIINSFSGENRVDFLLGLFEISGLCWKSFIVNVENSL